MLYCHIVEIFQPFSLQFTLLNQFRIHTFKIYKDNKLVNISMIPYISLKFRILCAPLLSSHAK